MRPAAASHLRAMEVIAALGLGAKELFNYNRENFKFDQDQRIEREALRLEMQVKRFELFREDVRDLVQLTVDRMDVYHLVGALFLEFCIILFCEGRVQASAPPFLLSLFLLSNACAFIYLMLAVWLSMHASIASHSFGVRLLTRFVRLPIPSIKQITALRSNLKDYERQGVANLLRLPFQDRQEWKQVHGVDENEIQQEVSPMVLAPDASEARLRKATFAAHAPKTYLETKADAPDSVPSTGVPVAQSIGKKSAPSKSSSQSSPTKEAPRTDLHHLAEEMQLPMLGGDDLLQANSGALPERHVQLFRQLQSKWQCYDAYCRVCMGLGVNQMLQALSYYCICHTLVENRSPSTGYALVVLFQSTTIALAVLDLAGLKRREILAIQVVGILPCLLSAAEVAHGSRTEDGVLVPDQNYVTAPLTFIFQVLWLELWLRVASPSGNDQAKLPRRFRQVLFLDVFGDSAGWQPAENDDEMQLEQPMYEDMVHANDMDDAIQAASSAAQAANSQLTMAQCAIRRWHAVPSWSCSKMQREELKVLSEQLASWGNTIHMELKRLGTVQSCFEPELRPWSSLGDDDRSCDPFAKCLLGPFEHDDGYKMACYHYDPESCQTLFDDAASKLCPGSLVLSLKAVASVMVDLEREARNLMEVRIMRDLSVANRNIHLKARHASRIANSQGASMSSDMVAAAAAADFSFPNLVGLFRRDEKYTLLGNAAEATRGESATSSASGGDAANRRAGQNAGPDRQNAGLDPTLRAMAGQHAKHFVPERLPWQVVSRMSRVLQLCWLWSGVMFFLKEAGIYQVDFQQRIASGGRRLLPVSSWSFKEISVDWPHGNFFRPSAIFCSAADGSVMVSSPYALYSIDLPESTPWRLLEVAKIRIPVAAVTVCWKGPEASKASPSTNCLMAAPSDEAIEFWPLGQELGADSSTVRLALNGAKPWIKMAAVLASCQSLKDMANAGSSCLVLAGWDGKTLPIAAIATTSLTPFRLDGGLLLPLFDVPTSAASGLAALHIESSRADSVPRLWLVLDSGVSELWDLSSFSLVASWKAALPFRPTAICVSPRLGMLALGRTGVAAVAMLSQLPLGMNETSSKEFSV